MMIRLLGLGLVLLGCVACSSDPVVPDAGNDAGLDAAVDAATADFGVDAGTDAGTLDSGLDAAMEDLGLDAGPADLGSDAAEDADVDAALDVDAGSDAGDALGLGDPCTDTERVCGSGLSCCYPCGIEGCESICTVTCDEGEPACAGGCYLYP